MDLPAILALVLLTFIWGGNAPALRFSLDYLPAFGSAGVRFFLATLVILGFAWRQRVPLWPARSQWLPLLWMGLLFAGQIGFLNLGATLTQANRQTLILNSYPLFVPLLAHWFLPGDRLSRTKIIGTLLAFLGVVFVFGEKALSGQGSLTGDFLIALSALLLAVKAIYTVVLLRASNEYQVLLWQMVFAVPCFFGLSWLTETQEYHWTPLVITSVLYQGAIVGGLCFIGWTLLMKRYSPTRLSVGFFMTPVFGTLLSYLLLNEQVTNGLFLGGAVVLAGLVVVNRPTK